MAAIGGGLGRAIGGGGAGRAIGGGPGGRIIGGGPAGRIIGGGATWTGAARTIGAVGGRGGAGGWLRRAAAAGGGGARRGGAACCSCGRTSGARGPALGLTGRDIAGGGVTGVTGVTAAPGGVRLACNPDAGDCGGGDPPAGRAACAGPGAGAASNGVRT